jgi:hypothetical protein
MEPKYNLLISLNWLITIAICAMGGLTTTAGKEWLIFAIIVLSFLFCGIVIIKNYFIIKALLWGFACLSVLSIGALMIAELIGLTNIYSTFIAYTTLAGIFIFDGAYFITLTTLEEAN